MKRSLLFILLLTAVNAYTQQNWPSHPGTVNELINYGNRIDIRFINTAGGECQRGISPFNDLLHFNINGPVDSLSLLGNMLYDVNPDYFVISNEYRLDMDSATFSDTDIIRQYYDSTINYTYYNDNAIFILDHSMDADSNYHFIGYSLNDFVNGSSLDPNKLFYFTTTGYTFRDSFGYYYPYQEGILHVPGHMTHHGIIDTMANNDMGNPEAKIFPIGEGAYLTVIKTSRTFGTPYYSHQVKVVKLDSIGNILSDSIIIGSNNHQYINAWLVDTIQHAIYIGINDDIETYLLIYDSFGNFQQKIVFNSWDQLQRFIAVKKQGYIYEPWSVDSSVIKYVNETGDTTKKVYFPVIFKNDITQTADGRYVQLDISIYRDVNYAINYYAHNDFIVTTYDSTGKFQKQFTTPILLDYYWESDPPTTGQIFSAIDQYGNIQFYTNYFKEENSHCNWQQANGGIFNIGYINQVNGHVTVDSIATAGIQVELVLNGHSYFTTSDDSGSYFFAPFDTGHGIIILHLDSNPQYENTGNDTFPVIISDTVANPVVNYLLRARVTSLIPHSKIKTSLYPNPFNTYTTLTFDYDKPAKLSILSVDGKIVRKYSDLLREVRIDKGFLPAGLYFYELRDEATEELLTTGKFVLH